MPRVWKSWAANAATVVMSAALAFVALEGALRAYAGFHDATLISPAPRTAEDKWAGAKSRHWLLSLPEEWKRREVSVPGAWRAFYWHGALHVLNEDHLRWSQPFPRHFVSK